MEINRVSESGSINVTVIPKLEWAEKLVSVQQEGNAMANRTRLQGLRFIVKPLAPREVLSEDRVPLSGVVLQPDWKIAKRLEMVESARDLIDKAYVVGDLDPALPTVLKSVIEGKGLYEYSIGEFFELYGRFEGKHGLKTGRQTRDKMEALVDGEDEYLKRYKEHDKWNFVPLPYAVRNILGHAGNNPNTLDPDGHELRTSIELLRSWLVAEQ